ncbi:FHA domain-containing protein [Pleurocapsa sp. PCC 7319]|uniref:FHA domain-containing protein n=1 Tax=Pleurocapsa sp. PCC 7319 TaxID=118161 RepID=UPI000348E890|nr:FHA domain-containing protein [Pleurocapsa sp. PCC 7319]
MPPKADKLSQTIESLQLFVTRKAQEREDLADISRQLAQLNKTLSHKKLTLQIVSDKLQLAQAVFDLINNQRELKRFFQLKFDELPDIPEPNAPQESVSLKLRQNLNNATGLQQYVELSPHRKYLIGRSPKADIAINPQLYQGVSWQHAAVRSLVAAGKTQWHIDDCQSTNGTFVNGERVQDSQALSSGDVITLACPRAGINVAEFLFSIRVDNSDREENKEYWDIVDCDLLMVTVDSQQGLTPEVKEFIQKLDLTYISQLYLLVDTPDSKQEPEAAKIADTNLKTIDTWLKSLPKSKWEVVPLFLKPWYTEDLGEIDPRQQKKQERFAKILGNVVKRQPENILAKRITVKVVRAAEPIEPLLEEQQQELSEKLAQEQQELASLSQVNFKEVSKKAIAEATQNKDKFFKQIKLDIAQSKAALLDGYSKKSVVYQIQDFVDSLTPVIAKKNGQKIIRLNDDSSNSDDINTSLISFCTDSLEKWATEEWHKVSHVYCNGGLYGLLDRLEKKTKIIPQVLSESPFSTPNDINVQNNFLISFAGTNCETIHKQKSLGAYIMKQLRSQMMQIMMMLTLVLGFVGIKSSKSQMMQNLSGTFKQQPWLFGIFVCGIIFLLINSYNSENDLKLDEAEVKLKKDLSSYYQSFTKNLLDKVVQDITLNLELEDKQIADGLEIVSEAYSDRLVEIEKKQIQIQNNLDKYTAQQKSLITELSEFEKLKQM